MDLAKIEMIKEIDMQQRRNNIAWEELQASSLRLSILGLFCLALCVGESTLELSLCLTSFGLRQCLSLQFVESEEQQRVLVCHQTGGKNPHSRITPVRNENHRSIVFSGMVPGRH